MLLFCSTPTKHKIVPGTSVRTKQKGPARQFGGTEQFLTEQGSACDHKTWLQQKDVMAVEGGCRCRGVTFRPAGY